MIKKAAEGLGIVILVVAILLAGFMFFGPRFGWTTHPVLSGSMEPALKVGGLVVSQLVKLEEIEEGDIITFQIGEQKITHRVLSINRDEEGKPWFQTKGDANEDSDPNLVSSEAGEVAQVVFYVPYVGFLAVFMKSKLGFLALVGIPAIILIVWYAKDIWNAIKIKQGINTKHNQLT